MNRRAANLLINLDPGVRGGLQRQVYESIRRAILDGAIRPGTRIPSSRALAADLGVSRTTTLLALEQLQAEGYLATRRGSGTFVAAELPDDLPLLRPQGAAFRSRPKHPPLSRRGAALAACRPAARRILGPPRPFRIGVPALDLFPVRVWSQLVSRRAAALTTGQLDYGEANGVGALREAIADHVRTARGTRCQPDQVHVVGSAQRGLDLICRLLLDPGDQAWMEEPGYPGAWTALIGAGAEIVPVPVDEEGLDVALGARRRGRVRLAYVTPSHQFPLGVPMSLPRRLALLKWASTAGAWVVEDDYDSEFRYGAPPMPCLHGLDTEGRVIYVGSFSKSVAPALRLGFIIVPPDLQDRLLAARRANVERQPPFLDQAVLADFIAGGHFARHLRRVRAAYRERLEALVSAAERFGRGALRLRPVRTGLHAVADLDRADATLVFEEARDRGVELMPVAAYLFGRGPGPNAVVLGFGATRPEAIEGGMKALVAAIEAAARPRAGQARLRVRAGRSSR
jgi:GntR family transcriptional regulator/MocR family aminotransferase